MYTTSSNLRVAGLEQDSECEDPKSTQEAEGPQETIEPQEEKGADKEKVKTAGTEKVVGIATEQQKEKASPKGVNRKCITYSRQSRTYHVSQQGRTDKPWFPDDASYQFYLNRLLNCLRAYRMQLHTYVLLPSQVHLLVSPHSREGLERTLDYVSAEYSAYFCNRWEKASPLVSRTQVFRLLENGPQVLDCQKHIELAPVREQLVKMPGEYSWSGYRISAFGGHSEPVAMHSAYRSFCFEGKRPYQRYRDYVAATSLTGSFHPAHSDCWVCSESV